MIRPISRLPPRRMWRCSRVCFTKRKGRMNSGKKITMEEAKVIRLEILKELDSFVPLIILGIIWLLER